MSALRQSLSKLTGPPLERRRYLTYLVQRCLRSLPEPARHRLFHGRAHSCPLCGSDVRGFSRLGYDQESWCPVCFALQRHRVTWLFFERCTNLLSGEPLRMLHFAPERAIQQRLEALPHLDYTTADLLDPRAMVQVNIEELPWPDATFDVVYCSHVLEHVNDDRRAMRELARVLKPDGWAFLLVPYREHVPTDEDLNVVDPAERERRFGQTDHVRFYGNDLSDRLTESGFDVEVVRPEDVIEPEEQRRIGLTKRTPMFMARPRSAPTGALRINGSTPVRAVTG